MIIEFLNKHIDWLNTYLFSPAGFLFSLATLCATINVNKKVNTALTKKMLIDESPNNIDKFSKFSNLIKNKNLSDSNAMELHEFLTELDQKYSSINKDISKLSTNSIEALQSKPNLDYVKLVDNFTRLSVILEREAK